MVGFRLLESGRFAIRRSAVLLWSLAIAGGTLGPSSAAEAFSAGFIENRGQVDGAVRYYLPGSGAAVYFTPQAVVLDLKGPPEPGAGATQHGCALYVRFAEANPSPRMEARSALATRYHYFLGNDPAGWRADVPAYAEVIYREVWPGIDLVFRDEGESLAYEALVRPGADPAHPAFAYEGAAAVRPGAAGAEEIETSAGSLVHERSGPAGAFRRVHAPSEPLGNPGALLWSTFLGGSNSELSRGLALDASGNVVLTGETYSTDFPTTPGAYDRSLHGSFTDVFVAKLSSGGGTLLWGTFVGGSHSDRGSAVALDASGNAVVTGHTLSSDFPTSPGAYDTSFNGAGDAFLTKLSSSGSALVWSTFLGGGSGDGGNALALTPSGDAVVTGFAGSTNFPTTPGAYDTSHNGAGDIFVAKMSSSGASLLGSTFVGGSSDDQAWGLALDAGGNAVVTGVTASANFPTIPGAYDTSFNGGTYDGFVTKLSASWNALLGSTYLGGSNVDWSCALDLDAAENAVVTGFTYSSGFPITPESYDPSFNGYRDVFVAKISSSGSSLLWGTFLGGGGWDEARALVVGPSGSATVAGETESSNFPTTSAAFDDSYNGRGDAFVSELSSTGRELRWSTFLGGSEADRGYALALDAAERAVVAGSTVSSNFPTTPGSYDRAINGYDDVFVAKHMGTPTSVPDPPPPDCTALQFSSPLPLAEGAALRFTLARGEAVDLRIFDVRGRRVATLAKGFLPAGRHDAAWPGRDDRGRLLPAGVYFLRFQAGEAVQVHRVVMLR